MKRADRRYGDCQGVLRPWEPGLPPFARWRERAFAHQFAEVLRIETGEA